MLHRLLFDVSNPAESANIGAYLRAGSDGDLLSSTNVGGKEGLDINLINTSIAVTGSDFDIRDLSAAQDNVAISDGTDTLAVNADGSINAVVSATNLDIRDLTHVSDSIKIGDGTDFLAIDASGNIGVTDAGGSLTVDAVNLDIRDLVAASDSVAAWLSDGAGNAITSSAGALDVNIASSDITFDFDDDLANTAIQADDEDVTAVSAALFTSVLANRKHVFLYNNGNKEVYIGPSGVAVTDGFPIFPGSALEARIGAAVAVHAISASGTQDIRILQLS